MPSFNKIPVGVIGATGFAGVELLALLSEHPHFRIKSIGSTNSAGSYLSVFYPQIKGSAYDLPLSDIEYVFESDIELLFLAVPHTHSFELVKRGIEKGIKVIDLSADFRLFDPALYEEYYDVAHPYPELLGDAVYGLSELNRKEIAQAQLVANPGCYPTASILSLAPLLNSTYADYIRTPVIIDAKSGVSGAGRKASFANHFCTISENMFAYKPFTHQHTPEISQAYSKLTGIDIEVLFVPHLIPVKRGLMASCYVSLAGTSLAAEELREIYLDYYSGETFVKICEQGELPKLKDAVASNDAVIGVVLDEKNQVITASCVIDNLGKGAASQALQNANIMFGFTESTGLLCYKAVV